MIDTIMSGYEVVFLLNILLSLVIGFLIGIERESRGKSAGISTHCFVIAGSMLFTMLSQVIEPGSQGRIAAQIITGVGFLGAGIILKGESGKILNLTTAASIWFSAAIGMALGFGWYLIAVIAVIYAVTVPRIPHLSPNQEHHDK